MRSGFESDWSDFFILPRCILWSPARAGKRVAQPSEVVKRRLARWPAERDQLWQAVVERSQHRSLEVKQSPRESKTKDPKRLERSVVSALRLGDVKKALQTLIAAPIAPSNEKTLECLKKLHPTGSLPDRLPPVDTPYLREDTVRTALSSFGPTSAAGLFGYRPRLLKECMSSEAARFPIALTSAVNKFASGQAPDFLKRFIAGSVHRLGEERHLGSAAVLRRPDPPSCRQVFLHRGSG